MVRVVDLERMRGGVAVQAVALRHEAPGGDGEILVAEKGRGRVGEVGPDEPASAAPERIPRRGEHPDVRLPPQVLLDARHGHRCARRTDVRTLVGGDHESAEVRVRDAAVDLGAAEEGNLAAANQADAPAEERNDVSVDERAELKDVEPFEEERA